MSDEAANRIPFASSNFTYDQTLTGARTKEVLEVVADYGFDKMDFTWQKVASSEYQRRDVAVSKLVHSLGYFVFNCTRNGELFFSRSPGVNSRVDEGTNFNWPDQLVAVKVWLDVLLAEIEASDDKNLTLAHGHDLFLYPKQIFKRDLASDAASSVQTGECLALIMMDLDKFKPINDSYGHPAGDEVLQSVAASLREVTRGKGSCYRYGGDEFSILLPNYSEDEAAALAERIRRKIESSIVGSKQLRVTASLGVAGIPTHATTADELLKKADLALYEAKKFRGNLVFVSGEPEPSTDEPRTTPRRRPDPLRIGEAETEKIRVEYFRAHFVVCPHDGSQLQIRELHSDETVTPDLDVSCPFCGLHERIPAPRRS